MKMRTLQESDKEFVCDIQAPCFQKLMPDEIDIVRRSKTQVLFRKGENLTKQGTFGSYIMFIIDGLVMQYVEGDSSKNFNIRLLQSGDFIGLSIVFDSNTFNYSTIAMRETKVYLVEKDAMMNLVKQNGEFAFSIVKRYSEHNFDLYSIIQNMMYKQMNGRLADALLYLSSETFIGESVFFLLSRKDIAGFAGLSVESTVKLLKSFEKDGILSLNEKDIIIKNVDSLKEISRLG
jgi:CRP-like cAMP-binding protein